MSFVIGNYADLTRFTVGNFSVLELAGRDRARAPLWRCLCRGCRQEQVLTHRALTTGLETRSASETLLCQNQACQFSRREPVRTETLRDVRIAERREREEAERIAKEQRDRAAKDAAERAANEAALAPMRADWRRYVQAAIKIGMPVSQIHNFDRWLQIGDVARNWLMERVAEAESKSQSQS